MNGMEASQPPARIARLEHYGTPHPKPRTGRRLSGEEDRRPRERSLSSASSDEGASGSGRRWPEALYTGEFSEGPPVRSGPILRSRDPVDGCLAKVRRQLQVFSQHPDFPDDGRATYDKTCGTFMRHIEDLFRRRQKGLKDEIGN